MVSPESRHTASKPHILNLQRKSGAAEECPSNCTVEAGAHELRSHEFAEEQMQIWKQLWLDDQGQDIAEYALMLAVILVIVILAVQAIGTNANTVFSKAASALQ